MKHQEQALSQIIPIVESLRAKAMKNDKNIEYIIGIDLGHGETSAALCPTEWDKPIEQLTPAKDLDMGGNKKCSLLPLLYLKMAMPILVTELFVPIY